MKLILKVELEYDAEIMHDDDKDAIDWFNREVLSEELIVHSNIIGDIIGTVRVLERLDG